MSSRREKPEEKLEDLLVEEIERIGGLCIKLEVKGDRGWPDRLCILPGGLTVFVEVKRPDGKGRVARLQELKLMELAKRGQRTFLLTSTMRLYQLIEGLEMEVEAILMRKARQERKAIDGARGDS